MPFTFEDFHPTTQVFLLFLKYITDGEGAVEPQVVPHVNGDPINWKEFFESGDGDVLLEGFGELFKTCGVPVLPDAEAAEAMASSLASAGVDKNPIEGNLRHILREKSLNNIYSAPAPASTSPPSDPASILRLDAQNLPRQDGTNYYPRADYDKRMNGQDISSSSASVSKRRKV